MHRNIVIYSDGTGQRGGIFFDEKRSNIYKMYRATRCGPDLAIDPAEQLTYYDPGLGTEPLGSSTLYRWYRKAYNIVSQATGLGITLNIIECYAALIRLWRPGDRIFLFGFSRGAYTVRALGGVLSFCGVPTRMPDGSPLRRDEASSLAIAREAVRQVYQFTNSRKRDASTQKQQMRLDQRELLAYRFREKYGSGDKQQSNAVPHFIGVFDTVASLANRTAVLGLIFSGLLALLLVGFLMSYFIWNFTIWSAIGLSAAAIVGVVWYVFDHLKTPGALPGYSARQTRHWTEFKMRFYDWRLSPRVPFARHAISIDENRKEFDRVPWGTHGEPNVPDENGMIRFEQVWFAGNHSDIGGSYAENDARLSDITLKWMLEAASRAGLKYDERWLRLFPDAAGPQHDEKRSGIFKYSTSFVRKIDPKAPLDQSVLDRLALPEVLQFDVHKPYRPEGLRGHESAADFYAD